MLQTSLNFDPSVKKHGGNVQSGTAHQRVVKTKQESYRKILSLLEERREHGATSKEIASVFGVQLNRISGRFSELRAQGLIKDSGARRDGAAVLVAVSAG